MARHIGPKRKLSRREGVDLFDEALRKSSPEVAARISQPPGQHGKRRTRTSVFGTQLREKQKIKRLYGVLERQFRKYYNEAERSKEVTGHKLLKILETRLDNVVYRLGLSLTRAQARKMIGEKKIKVNDTLVTIPSYRVKEGDKITLANENVVIAGEQDPKVKWLSWDKTKKIGTVKALPVRDDIEQDIEEQLVIEFYSR